MMLQRSVCGLHMFFEWIVTRCTFVMVNLGHGRLARCQHCWISLSISPEPAGEYRYYREVGQSGSCERFDSRATGKEIPPIIDAKQVRGSSTFECGKSCRTVHSGPIFRHKDKT